ncbi:MAG: Fic family protein [candidate division Zixibacteria bacterium]|nr:Fic family protein [candidate division Zixibacteria bacterium]MBU1470436.1 Fic family protein [candidate division Zixibacteria bacterium]MBU2625885.1 Fic family protein [candidate division Zixibacteria bacterium]
MRRGITGRYVTTSVVGGETCKAFIPDPLPPNPPLVIDDNMDEKIYRALVALGRLDAVSTLLPDTSLFLYMYVRKEAVLSSQIEGTQSSLSDLLLFEDEEVPGVPMVDTQEVSNYVAAINHGLARLRDGFPLSLRLLREIHEILLSKGRGEDKDPGQFRRTQNWIGGTRPGNAVFVPPPPENIIGCMGDLEKFLHNKPMKTTALLKAALVHPQFETIHPFLDGNGRLGRLLITLLFCEDGTLKEPMLYLSLFFKTNRERYYELLQKTRMHGDWEEWVEFFITGVRETATQAVETANSLNRLFEEDKKEIGTLGQSANSAYRVHDMLQQRPIASIPRVAKMSGLSIPTVGTALRRLESLGIAQEITGNRRNKLFTYKKYLKILNEGTEPL